MNSETIKNHFLLIGISILASLLVWFHFLLISFTKWHHIIYPTLPHWLLYVVVEDVTNSPDLITYAILALIFYLFNLHLTKQNYYKIPIRLPIIMGLLNMVFLTFVPEISATTFGGRAKFYEVIFINFIFISTFWIIWFYIRKNASKAQSIFLSLIFFLWIFAFSVPAPDL